MPSIPPDNFDFQNSFPFTWWDQTTSPKKFFPAVGFIHSLESGDNCLQFVKK